ncbi:MAG: hypothetical protein ACR2PW_00535 [Gammaproteobacteria bacterium]
MIDQEKLCYSLIHSDSEEDVIAELSRVGLWSSPNNWRPLGKNPANWSVVGNQQDDAYGAMAELLINSCDAILMRKCIEANICPKNSHEAPKNIYEAVERFFDYSPRRLDQMPAKERGQLAASLIGVIATGAIKGKDPCYSIYDTGEGQRPEDFENTFLSINNNNKMEVAFVQGKYCQGSHGSIVNCGENHFKLIVSKSHSDHGDPQGKWGFSLLRRREPKDNERMSVVEYLTIDKQVPNFTAANLQALPGDWPLAYEKPLSSGTFLKLYEYKTKTKSAVTTDLMRAISGNISQVSLPIRFYERRKFGNVHTLESTLLGLENQLKNDAGANIQDNFPQSAIMGTVYGNLPVTFYALKSEVKRGKYQRDRGILLTVNGQTHHSLSYTAWASKKFSLDVLKDSLICIIDCSGLSSSDHEKIFKTSRDRVNKDAENEIMKCLKELVDNNRAIKELKHERQQERLNSKIANNKHSEELMREILKNSPHLTQLLVNKGRISAPFDQREQLKQTFEGKEHPTYFVLDKEFPIERPKPAEIGRKCRVQFKTDVCDNYLNPNRQYPGSFQLTSTSLEPLFDLNLYKGICTLNIEIPDALPVDEILKFEYSVTDDAIVSPFGGSFFVKTVNQKRERSSDTPGKRRENEDEKNGSEKNESLAGPPVASPVYRDEWEKREMTEDTALIACHDEGLNYHYFYNADNKFLKLHQKHNSKSNPEVLQQQFAIALHYQALTYVISQPNAEPLDISKTIKEYTTGAAASILDVMNALATLDDA